MKTLGNHRLKMKELNQIKIITILAFLEKKIKQRGIKCLLYVHQLNPDPGDNSIDFIVIIKLGLFRIF
jgi:hypothetical protein